MNPSTVAPNSEEGNEVEVGSAAKTSSEDLLCDSQRLSALRRLALLESPPEKALDRACRLAARVLRAPIVMISLIAEEQQLLRGQYGLPDSVVERRSLPIGHSFCRLAIMADRAYAINDALADPKLSGEEAIRELGFRAYAGVPLVSSDQHRIGVFCVADAEPRAWTQEDLANMDDIAAFVTAEIELRSQSIHDPLTGLFNRRYMEEALTREVLRTARSGGAIGLLMLDLDHFKAINDQYGHKAGDALLVAISAHLHERIRGADIACRFGGEEFVLILPDAALEHLVRRADHLRKGLSGVVARWDNQEIGGLTASVGVAALPDHAATANELLLAADNALYRAKAEGRNRTAVAERPLRSGAA